MLAAIGAAAISIPIIIHLMSRFRRQPEAWGAMRFLIEAYRKQRKRLQLEKLLLLLVRCMVVMLAGLALAGPVLSGCSKNGLTLTGSGGRIVYIVIDDALSSQTREAGTTRLAEHQAEALRVIDEMSADDRAVVVRMAKPARLVLDKPTSDREALRKAVESIKPRFSRGVLLEALSQVNQSMDAEGLRDGEAVVVLLSDFPQSADYFEKALPPELEGFGKRASLVTALPPEGTSNVQVVSLLPRRWMLVAEPTGATVVGGRAELLRYGAIDQVRTAELVITIGPAEGEALVSTKRTVTWPVGERQQGVNFDLPVPLPVDEVRGSSRELVVTAQLVPDAAAAGVDVLSADDRAFAVVRLRGRLQVALVDDAADVNPNAGEFEPGQWVRAALTPSGPSGSGSFELSPMLPTSVNAESLEPYDAAMVLRPDEVTPRGWASLHAFADAGGLVWVFAPAIESKANWAGAMTRAFDVPWTIGEELVSKQDEQGAVQSVDVDATTAAPDVLQFLAADWREKLGWVSVRRWLPLEAPQEDRWIELDAQQLPTQVQAKPTLMAYRSVGRGSLVFNAVPLDTRFTNLPVRALFVPLMHDTLRGVLGNAMGQPPVVAGDKPALDASWRGIGELTQVGASEEADAASVMVSSEGDTTELSTAVEAPGVYRGSIAGSPRLLAVNVDAAAGDTFGGKGELELLLDKFGGWAYLSDKRDAGGVLTQTTVGQDLTMVLLWVLLGFVLLEMTLARWFSHATDRSRPTIVGRVIGALHGDESAKPANTGGGA